MTDPNIVSWVAWITASGIGLGSLYFGIRHGNAALTLTRNTDKATEKAFGDVVHILQDIHHDLDRHREVSLEQHALTRSLILSETEKINTHATQGHMDTRAVIRDLKG